MGPKKQDLARKWNTTTNNPPLFSFNRTARDLSATKPSQNSETEASAKIKIIRKGRVRTCYKPETSPPTLINQLAHHPPTLSDCTSDSKKQAHRRKLSVQNASRKGERGRRSRKQLKNISKTTSNETNPHPSPSQTPPATRMRRCSPRNPRRNWRLQHMSRERNR